MYVTHLRSGFCAVKSRSSRFFTPTGQPLATIPKSCIFRRSSMSCHQASKAVQADGFAFAEQILVNLPNTPCSARILLSMWTWITILPSVITIDRDPEATTHHSFQVLVAAALDHRVPLDYSLAK